METTRCSTSQLAIALERTQGSAGHVGVVFIFKNDGTTCVLQGYPGVDGVLNDGTHVVSAERTLLGYLGGEKEGSPEVIVLSAGDTASALVEGLTGGVEGQPCLAYTTYVVTAPDDTQSSSLRSPYPLCYLEVHPVVSGETGGQNAP